MALARQLRSRRVEGSAIIVGGTPAISPGHGQALPPTPVATAPVPGRRGGGMDQAAPATPELEGRSRRCSTGVIPMASPSPPPPIHAIGLAPRESPPCGGMEGERGGRPSKSHPGLPAALRRRKKRPPGRLRMEPKRQLRGRREGSAMLAVGGGILIGISPAAYLRPPSPERNAPRADGGADGRKGPAPPELEEARGLGEAQWRHPGDQPPPRPRSQRVAAVKRLCPARHSPALGIAVQGAVRAGPEPEEGLGVERSGRGWEFAREHHHDCPRARALASSHRAPCLQVELALAAGFDRSPLALAADLLQSPARMAVCGVRPGSRGQE